MFSSKNKSPMIIIYVYTSFTVSWRQNEFCSVPHWFEDLTHPLLWCVANFVGVLVPKQQIHHQDFLKKNKI